MVDWATSLVHLEKPEEAKKTYKRYFKVLISLGQQPDTLSCQHYAAILSMLGKYEKAEKWCIIYLERIKKAYGEYSVMTVDALLQLASALEHQRKYKAAIAMGGKILSLLKAIDENHEKVIACMQHMATVQFLMGEEDTACKTMEEAVARKKKQCGEEHLDTLWLMSQLAYMLRQTKKTQEAEALLEHLVAAFGKVKGTENPYTLRLEIGYCEYPYQN